MKSFELKTPNSLIVIDVRLINKAFRGDFKMALDTACTQTFIRPEVLRAIGVLQKDFLRKISVTTGSRNDAAYEFQIDGLETLDFRIKKLKVVAKDLPKGLLIDGLLGLDFFGLSENHY